MLGDFDRHLLAARGLRISFLSNDAWLGRRRLLLARGAVARARRRALFTAAAALGPEHTVSAPALHYALRAKSLVVLCGSTLCALCGSTGAVPETVEPNVQAAVVEEALAAVRGAPAVRVARLQARLGVCA